MASQNSNSTFDSIRSISVRESRVMETLDEKWLRTPITVTAEPVEQRSFADINHQYDGGRHWMKGRRYLNPTPHAVGKVAPLPPSELMRHRDILGRITQRPRDLLRYISPTYGKPSHILVQATATASLAPQGEWRQVPVRGTAPTILRLSVWALGDGQLSAANFEEVVWTIGKTILIIPLQLFVLSWPFGSSRQMQAFYPEFPSRSWDYPKYARNPLDANPNAVSKTSWNGAVYDIAGDQQRLLRPRLMMINNDGTWELREGTSQPYIVISYTTKHFKPNATGYALVARMAEEMAYEAGVDAYWLDFKCRVSEQPQLTDDVHRICDVFRGARQVCIILPDLSIDSKQEWGSRMWTLTEVLLSASHKVKFCTSEETEEMSKLELAAGVWTDGEPTRLLAEHYTGLLTLSRLELISLGLKALSSRKSEKEWTPGDIAYALMALLRYRPRMNPEDSLFQALARLSLANDSDRIVERMVCMLPDPMKTHHTAFVLEDILGANLWDIEPLCQVAGVGNGNEVILDGCRGISIRWKDIPQIAFGGRVTWKKWGASTSLRSGPAWFLVGIYLTVSGNVAGGVIVLLIGLALILVAPWAVVALYGGKVWSQSPWLIGIEGTLPLSTLERLTFGNAINRLSYAPSSNLLSRRHPTERIGLGPAFIENPGAPDSHPPILPPGHRIFTLLDTGSMTVTVFSAVRPPSVALVCGKEGGMVRVVLGSYERGGDFLRRESVVRMESVMVDRAVRCGWVKVCW